MWHASVCGDKPAKQLVKLCLNVLSGTGNKKRQWWDQGIARGLRVVHLRRRLREDESRLVGPVRDIRGTDEVLKRAEEIASITGFPADWLLEMG